jgi:anti-sigma-K factor RskA
MNCEEADELLGAYATDALPDEDMRRVREHLRGCERHAREAEELRAVTSRLSALVEPVQPPAALRSRVLDAIASTPQEAAPAQTATIVRPVARRESRAPVQARPGGARERVTWGGSRFRATWGALAAVLVLAVGGLLAWNIALMNRLDDRDDPARFASRASAVASLRTSDGASAGAVVYFDDEGKVAVLASDVEDPGDGRTYQMWVIRDGQPESLGLAHPRDGQIANVAAYQRRAGDRIALTIEPAGGSVAPTSDPALIADL